MTTNNLIMLVVAVTLLGWIIVQQVTTIRVSLRRMWFIPLALGIYTFTQLKPDSLNDDTTVLALGAALVVGSLVGIVRGSFNRVEFDGQRGQLVVRGSVLGLAIWLAFMAGEITLRVILNNGSLAGTSTLGTVVPLAMVTAMFAGWRFSWYMKYLQLAPRY